MAGFGLMLAYQPDLVDPRVTYVLHEIGEETRHSRLFLRVVEQLAPSARNPFTQRWYSRLDRLATTVALGMEGHVLRDGAHRRGGARSPATSIQRASRHRPVRPRGEPLPPRRGGASPVVRSHAAARALGRVPPRTERWLVRHVAPLAMEGIFDSLVHPGVYRTVGLPGWRTWNRVRVSAERRAPAGRGVPAGRRGARGVRGLRSDGADPACLATGLPDRGDDRLVHGNGRPVAFTVHNRSRSPQTSGVLTHRSGPRTRLTR